MYLATLLLCANLLLVTSATCPNFLCLPDNDREVVIQELLFTCPGNLTCNKNGIDNCIPCVKDKCEFVCADNQTLAIEGELFRCPEGYYCNSDKEENDECNWCLPLPCSQPKIFTCVTKTTVSVFGLLLSCYPGKVCNEDWVSPCAVCVDDDGHESSPTTPPPTSTTTAYTTVASTVPDCNDGKKKMCRPLDSSAYVKCFATWTGDFITQKRNCSDLAADLICQQDSGICV